MSINDGVILQVLPAPDGDARELAEWTNQLRAWLRELDVDADEPMPAQQIPDGAKGPAAMLGWLVIHLGTAETLRTVLAAIAAWCARTNRTVEITDGPDVLKLTGVSVRQQERIIDEWIARHPARA